ncbi:MULTISPECIES: hypothetical protein [Megasphaera]|uniref:Uncharacterized protein n=2 Tax=Megasphaera TaxID=906 RepID=A0ABT1SRU6_9FIRM|nr:MULTISPECIES: hypothetical protein [Megasphaera]KXA69244.1 hypothetical protein HMPREF3201_01235 [Megasphaera sp. MJR8396C]MBS6137394.1 hypothetical protein [Megasphaera sp.]MCB6233126.1 hypothetical protein [Megasphaera massiliensis]MCB6403936.1 hypothetical protein [Megasphaera massiliensis]MCB7348610.1 hypothetical protein [Megasphaera massiliensis]
MNSTQTFARAEENASAVSPAECPDAPEIVSHRDCGRREKKNFTRFITTVRRSIAFLCRKRRR